MKEPPEYIKHVDVIRKEEFLYLFSTTEATGKWFSDRELGRFSLEKNAGSLAARYLIKKRICDHVGDVSYPQEIEILNDRYGRPKITLGKNIRMATGRAGIKGIHCSISHSRNYITGMTIFSLV